MKKLLYALPWTFHFFEDVQMENSCYGGKTQ